MVQIVTTSGPVVVNDEIITRVISRTVDFPYTHVWGPGGSAPLEVPEDATTLVARLSLARPLAKLTAPAGDQIWIKGSAVSLVRPATPFEHGAKAPFINSIAIVAGRTQSMNEDFLTAYTALVDAGANLPSNLMTITAIQGEVQGYSAHVQLSPQVFQVW